MLLRPLKILVKMLKKWFSYNQIKPNTYKCHVLLNSQGPNTIKTGNLCIKNSSQLAHDVVTTLGFVVFWSRRRITLSQHCHVVFGTSFLQPKTNVVTTLYFRSRFSNLVLRLQQGRDSHVVFLTKI